MSFGINGPDNNLSAIQKSHHTSDGGAGNLGYFKRQKDENKEKNEKEESDVFEFSSSSEDIREDVLMEELDSIGTKIKNFWMALKFNKEHREEKNKS